MFKRKKKKIGCETPEFRKPTPPPPPLPATPFEEKYYTPKTVARFCVDTNDRLTVLMEKYRDIVKIENAEVYLSIEDGILAIVATQEWKDYLMGRSNIMPSTKEETK